MPGFYLGLYFVGLEPKRAARQGLGVLFSMLGRRT